MNVRQSWQDFDPQELPQTLAGRDVPWIVEARRNALSSFKARGFPSRRDEEWKYTDVSAIARRASLLPDNIPPDAPSEAALYAWMLSQQKVHLMVFVNGHYSPELSYSRSLGPGVRLESFADLLDSASDLPPLLFGDTEESSSFEALNSAFATDGSVLLLQPGARLEMPLYLLFIASGHDVSIYPRNLVVAGENARATIIEHYLGMVDTHNFTNSNTRIELGAGAVIEHCKLQQEGGAAYHLASIQVGQAADSHFTSHSFAFGGRLARNDINVQLREPAAHCTLNGLYVINGRQLCDHHTRIDHLVPGCTSREYYRGVLDGEARGVFSGKVIVHPGAGKTDAHQSNHSLLLSPQAEVDTKPQLEIYADDVRCTHGATVGQLDEGALFYLRSRGMDAQTARAMLVYGFANEVIDQVPVADLRNRIVDVVLDRFSSDDNIKSLFQ